jgi:hypothetical protein
VNPGDLQELNSALKVSTLISTSDFMHSKVPQLLPGRARGMNKDGVPMKLLVFVKVLTTFCFDRYQVGSDVEGASIAVGSLAGVGKCHPS